MTELDDAIDRIETELDDAIASLERRQRCYRALGQPVAVEQARRIGDVLATLRSCRARLDRIDDIDRRLLL